MSLNLTTQLTPEQEHELNLQRRKMWTASISNHSRYMNPSTELFDEKFVEHTRCPVCDSDKDHFLFRKSGGRYVECIQCKMVYLNPTLKQEYLSEYYQINHSEQAATVSSDISFYSRLYNQGLDSMVAAGCGKTILDIGCSSGVFLDIARERGFETFGIELNQSERTLSEKKGHKVFHTPIEELTIPVAFDAVTLWDVFEHIKNPRRTLLAVSKRLSKHGIFFVQVPSADSLAARILQEKCNMFDGLEHVNIFGKAQLRSLGESCGFRLTHLESVIPETRVISNYLSFQDPYLGNCPGNRKSDYLEGLLNLSDKTILQNHLGYKLQATFQKID